MGPVSVNRREDDSVACRRSSAVPAEALGFIITADIGLDDAAADEVFLHGAVHAVHLLQHFAKARLADLHEDGQNTGQERNGDQKDHRQMRRDRKGHDCGHQ